MGEGYAWVTLATNDSYSLGALVLAHSLKQVGTGHQLAVLVTPGVTTAMREKLAAVFNLVQEVNVLDSKDETNLRLLKRPELGITFTKLHCWRLTQFDKCVFLDADALVLQHCDELFDREELSAAPDVGWPDCFNTGVFVYRPSNETYEKLVQFALEKGSFDGGDQGLLNLYFSDWATKDISKHLPFIYNLCSTACYSYLPAFKQFGLNAKIIHFIGSSKPWLQYFNTETRTVQPSEEVKHLQGALQYWWNIFCSVIHPQLTTEMARSTSDVTHTSISSCTSQNHDKPQSSSTKIVFFDPWEEYDQKQSILPTPQMQSVIVSDQVNFTDQKSSDNRFQEPTSPRPSEHQVYSFSSFYQINEPSQIKPVESHNTNAYNARHKHSLVSTYDQPKKSEPAPHYFSNPPQTVFKEPQFVPTKISPTHSLPPPSLQPLPPSSLRPPFSSLPLLPSSSPSPQPPYSLPPQPPSSLPPPPSSSPPPSPHQCHHVPETSVDTVYSSQDSQQTELLTCAPKPIAPFPLVQSHECEAAATVCNESTLHTAYEDETNTGLAGAFAQLTLGAPRTAEQSALDDHLRRQGWETGNIDYMGRDSFDNIWSKICETLTAGLPSPPTSPPEKTTETASPPARHVDEIKTSEVQFCKTTAEPTKIAALVNI